MAVSLLVVLVPPLLFCGDWSTWIYRGTSVPEPASLALLSAAVALVCVSRRRAPSCNF